MWYLAQYSSSNTSNAGLAATGIIIIIIGLLFVALAILAVWKVFTKAGQAGWKAIIPIYSTVIMLRIVGLSGWLVLLSFVPFVNLFFSCYLAYKLAKAFGRGVGMAILLIFAIGFFILGLGKAQYLGPDGKGSSGQPPEGMPPQPPLDALQPQQPIPQSFTPVTNPMPPTNPQPPQPPITPTDIPPSVPPATPPTTPPVVG